MPTGDRSPIPRPHVFARTLVALFGGVAILLGGAFATSAIFEPVPSEIPIGIASLGGLYVSMDSMSIEGRRLLAIVLLASGALLLVIYGRTSFLVRTKLVAVDGRRLPQGLDSIEFEAARSSVSVEHAIVFWEALMRPANRFLRISESAEFGTRTMRVTSTFTIATDDLNPGLHAMPIILSERGSLVHGPRFTASDSGRISSLSHTQSAAFAIECVRKLINGAGPTTADEFVRARVDGESLSDWVCDILSAPQARPKIWVDQVTDEMAMLPHLPGKAEMLASAAAIVRVLRDRYPICVPVVAPHPPKSGKGTPALPMRVTADRVAIAAPRIRGDLRRNFWELLVSLHHRAEIVLNGALGIQPPEIAFPTSLATRTSSYHLTLRGPEGTYLSQQELLHANDTGERVAARELRDLPYTMNARYGQRTAHLYVRDGRNFDKYEYSCHYAERMPGSMSTAFVGALTTLVVAGAIAMASVSTPPEDVGATLGLLQILLAFPLALTATSSFTHGAPFWGGDLGARAATIVTVTVLAFSLWVSTAALFASRSTLGLLWAIVLVIAAGNTLFTLVSWFTRAATQRAFLHRETRTP